MKRFLAPLMAFALAGAVVLGLSMTSSSIAHESEAHEGDFANMGMGMMGSGMHQGRMGSGMHQGRMGSGMHQGRMGPGQMGYGMGPCNVRADIDRDLSVEDVTEMLQTRLEHWGNPRLSLGKVIAQDDDTIVAEIVTKDGSVVDKLAIDRDTGSQRRIR